MYGRTYAAGRACRSWLVRRIRTVWKGKEKEQAQGETVSLRPCHSSLVKREGKCGSYGQSICRISLDKQRKVQCADLPLKRMVPEREKRLPVELEALLLKDAGDDLNHDRGSLCDQGSGNIYTGFAQLCCFPYGSAETDGAQVGPHRQG